MISFDFIVTSLIVVLLPGTGVLYTISNGLFKGKVASLWAATGCTLGIVPHLLMSIFGLSMIIHQSALAFQTIKYMGVIYLFYLAWNMWNSTGAIAFKSEKKEEKGFQILIKAILINILNPKLTIFFLSFLPQFVPSTSSNASVSMLLLSSIFMIITLIVFVIYGVFASKAKSYLTKSVSVVKYTQKSFALFFAFMGIKLALSEK